MSLSPSYVHSSLTYAIVSSMKNTFAENKHVSHWSQTNEIVSFKKNTFTEIKLVSPYQLVTFIRR